jgi:hypothetical protein
MQNKNSIFEFWKSGNSGTILEMWSKSIENHGKRIYWSFQKKLNFSFYFENNLCIPLFRINLLRIFNMINFWVLIFWMKAIQNYRSFFEKKINRSISQYIFSIWIFSLSKNINFRKKTSMKNTFNYLTNELLILNFP